MVRATSAPAPSNRVGDAPSSRDIKAAAGLGAGAARRLHSRDT